MDSQEIYLQTKLDYAGNILSLLNECDVEAVKIVIKKDIARCNRMLSKQYEEAARADHVTENQFYGQV